MLYHRGMRTKTSLRRCARTLALIKGVQLVGSVSPGKVSRRRRNQWGSEGERQRKGDHHQRGAKHYYHLALLSKVPLLTL